MVDSIKDLLQKKADKFDEDHSTLEQIQAILDKRFNGDVRALKITDDNTLIVTTSNAALASDVRLTQEQLLAEVRERNATITSLHIKIA